MPESAIPLAYAPRPRRHRRILRYITVVLVLAASWSLWHWWTPMREWTRVMSWQRKMERYTAPADRITFTTDPTEMKRLLREVLPGFSGPREWCVSPFDLIIEQRGPLPATPMAPMVGAGPSYPAGHSGVIFLHECHTPAGGHRLVVGYVVFPFTIKDDRQTPPLILCWNVYDLTWRGPVFRVMTCAPAIACERDGQGITFFAGQPDSSDATHFTLGYRYAESDGTIDGWLGDDNQIKVAPREGRWGTFFPTTWDANGRATTQPANRSRVWCPPGSTRPPSEFDEPLTPVLTRPK